MLTLLYLTFGSGLYVGLWGNNEKPMSAYSNTALIKGLLCIFIWPVFVVLYLNKKSRLPKA